MYITSVVTAAGVVSLIGDAQYVARLASRVAARVRLLANFFLSHCQGTHVLDDHYSRTASKQPCFCKVIKSFFTIVVRKL
jgi:hypothetical protein